VVRVDVEVHVGVQEAAIPALMKAAAVEGRVHEQRPPRDRADDVSELGGHHELIVFLARRARVGERGLLAFVAEHVVVRAGHAVHPREFGQ
jgi:hypothetical protein